MALADVAGTYFGSGAGTDADAECAENENEGVGTECHDRLPGSISFLCFDGDAKDLVQFFRRVFRKGVTAFNLFLGELMMRQRHEIAQFGFFERREVDLVALVAPDAHDVSAGCGIRQRCMVGTHQDDRAENRRHDFDEYAAIVSPQSL